MNHILSFRVVAGGLACLLVTSGCTRRHTGTINVDEVQSFANEIEKNLREMRVAIGQRNFDRAGDKLQEAREVLAEHRSELEAYPELEELKQRLSESAGDLCYSRIQAEVQGFFESVRSKALGDARRKHTKLQQGLGDCRATIQSREDFAPLAINVESTAEALASLEKELELAQRAKSLPAVEADLKKRLSDLQAVLVAIDAQHSPEGLVQRSQRELAELKAVLQAHPELVDLPEWGALRQLIGGELTTLEAQLPQAIAMGRMRYVAEVVVPRADAGLKETSQAPKAGKRALAERTRADYLECAEKIRSLFKANPGLSKASIKLASGAKKISFFVNHCDFNGKQLDSLIRKLPKTP